MNESRVSKPCDDRSSLRRGGPPAWRPAFFVLRSYGGETLPALPAADSRPATRREILLRAVQQPGV
jgi:hypothetical protein